MSNAIHGPAGIREPRGETGPSAPAGGRETDGQEIFRSLRFSFYKESGETDLEDPIRTLYTDLCERITPCCRNAVAISMPRQVILLMNYLDESEEGILDLMQEMYQKHRNEMLKKYGLTVTMTIGGGLHGSIRDLYFSTSSMEESRMSFLSSPGSGVPVDVKRTGTKQGKPDGRLPVRSSVSSAAAFLFEYIGEHFREDISLTGLSELVHLSSKYISDLFRNTFGFTITAYLTECRVEEARRLLAETGFSIAEISASVGISDPKHFSKLFKKSVGLSPLQYRRQTV